MEHEQPSDNTQPFDLEAMMARCLGKLELMDRALVRFESVAQTDLERLARAVDGADATEIARIAHRLKGASSNVSALRVQAQATELEELARADKSDDLSDCLQRLQEEVSHFSQCVASCWQTQNAS